MNHRTRLPHRPGLKPLTLGVVLIAVLVLGLITVSMAAPAAPSEWPIMAFVELTGTRPNSLAMAAPSLASLNGVAVPCALM